MYEIEELKKLTKQNYQTKAKAGYTQEEVFIYQNIDKGEKLSENNIIALRPSTGICVSNGIKL